MAMEITNNYSSYATQSVVENDTENSTKKKETEKTTETLGSSKGKKTTDYANGLAKLVPSVDFKVGNACSSAQNGKSLTVNPKLLEKMQNDPEEEKSTPNKAEQLLNEKLAASKEGIIYLNNTDIRTIIEAAKEDNNGKTNTKQEAEAGANLDLKV